MLYEANIYQMNVEEHTFWVAESKALKGCVGQGDTSEEAIKELEVNELEWIKTAQEFGIPIPPQYVKPTRSYSGKIALRVSPIVHEDAVRTAASLGISTNQLINDALVSYIEKVNDRSKRVTNRSVQGDTIGKVVVFPGKPSLTYSVSEELEEM